MYYKIEILEIFVLNGNLLDPVTSLWSSLLERLSCNTYAPAKMFFMLHFVVLLLHQQEKHDGLYEVNFQRKLDDEIHLKFVLH